MKPYKVNVSSINQYANCPFRWWAQYVMNWVPREEAKPLAFGRLLHNIFEEHARGAPMDVAILICKEEWTIKAVKTNDPFETAVLQEALAELEDVSEALVQWEDQYHFDIPVLEAEEPFEMPHPMDNSIILIGRPDRVAVMKDKVWHIQNRGLSQSINFGIYTDLARRHYHEHVYAEHLAHKYSTWPYGGTVFNLLRKLKYRTNITKKNPQGKTKELSEMLSQFPMSIDLKSPLHDHIMESVLRWARMMRTAEQLWKEQQYIPQPNEHMNGGYYGNKPDVYFRVLTGEIELGDEKHFKKRVNPYE